MSDKLPLPEPVVEIVDKISEVIPDAIQEKSGVNKYVILLVGIVAVGGLLYLHNRGKALENGPKD